MRVGDYLILVLAAPFIAVGFVIGFVFVMSRAGFIAAAQTVSRWSMSS